MKLQTKLTFQKKIIGDLIYINKSKFLENSFIR